MTQSARASQKAKNKKRGRSPGSTSRLGDLPDDEYPMQSLIREGRAQGNTGICYLSQGGYRPVTVFLTKS